MTKKQVQRLQYAPEQDVLPQAIFWRPLRWFTMVFRAGADDLDTFEAASYAIGNEITFDLRAYRGHPDMTVSLYLSVEIEDDKQVSEIIDIVVREMFIPATAIAWRRGQPFVYGELKRPEGDRLREAEARIIVLKMASQQPERFAPTSFLKKEAPKYIQLSEADLVRSVSRPNERLYQQVIGNVVSHHKTSEGPFVKGYAVRTGNGLSVTEKGMDYLNSMGFEVSTA